MDILNQTFGQPSPASVDNGGASSISTSTSLDLSTELQVDYEFSTVYIYVTYNYAQFGNKRRVGFQFYLVRQEYIEASDTVFIHRQMLEMQCCLAYVL